METDRGDKNKTSIRDDLEDVLKEVKEYVSTIAAGKEECLKELKFHASNILYCWRSFLDEVLVIGGAGDLTANVLCFVNIPLDIDIMFVVNFACTVLDTTALSEIDSEKFVYIVEMSKNNSMYILKDGKYYLTHEVFKDMTTETDNTLIFRQPFGRYTESTYIHGPVNTTELSGFNPFGLPITGYDIVPTIACHEIPRIALEFFSRHGGCWLPSELLDEIYERGCYFVPKGPLGSPSNQYEWQISFAHSETMLITKFNSTMFCTYALLKLMKHRVYYVICGFLL